MPQKQQKKNMFFNFLRFLVYIYTYVRLDLRSVSWKRDRHSPWVQNIISKGSL